MVLYRDSSQLKREIGACHPSKKGNKIPNIEYYDIIMLSEVLIQHI
ncbi:hypothetical protein JOD03_001818 [Chryseomicrobium aureum]|nr:hypothetical protein [Chryseomicrobium aureum]